MRISSALEIRSYLRHSCSGIVSCTDIVSKAIATHWLISFPGNPFGVLYTGSIPACSRVSTGLIKATGPFSPF